MEPLVSEVKTLLALPQLHHRLCHKLVRSLPKSIVNILLSSEGLFSGAFYNVKQLSLLLKLRSLVEGSVTL